MVYTPPHPTPIAQPTSRLFTDVSYFGYFWKILLDHLDLDPWGRSGDGLWVAAKVVSRGEPYSPRFEPIVYMHMFQVALH